MKRKLNVICIFITAMAILLSACGGNAFTEEDAKKMVKAELDAAYYGDFAAAEEVFGETETSQKNYDEMLEFGVNSIKEGIDGSDDYIEDWLALMQKAFKCIKYEIVGAANEDENTWVVTVRVSPLLLDDIFGSAVSEEVITEELEKLDEQTINELYSDEDKIMDWSTELTIRLVNEALNQPLYGEEKTIDIKVVMTDGAWTVDADDLSMFDSAAVM